MKIVFCANFASAFSVESRYRCCCLCYLFLRFSFMLVMNMIASCRPSLVPAGCSVISVTGCRAPFIRRVLELVFVSFVVYSNPCCTACMILYVLQLSQALLAGLLFLGPNLSPFAAHIELFLRIAMYLSSIWVKYH